MIRISKTAPAWLGGKPSHKKPGKKTDKKKSDNQMSEFEKMLQKGKKYA